MTAESANQSVATLIGTMTSIACSDSPLSPRGEGWGKGPGSEPSGKGCAVFHTTVLSGAMTPSARSDSPLFPAREGWGEGPGSETLVEKAAPFSTLRFYPGR